MICSLRASSEYCSRFLATRMLSRALSIHRFFSSGCTTLIDAELTLLPNGFAIGAPFVLTLKLWPVVSEVLPCKP